MIQQPTQTPLAAPRGRAAKSALLVGYYGHRNTGDDAFLLISAWAASSILGCPKITATSHILPQMHGIPVASAYYPGRLPKRRVFDGWSDVWASRNTDHVIFGGGSNFHSKPGIEHFLKMLEASPKGRHFAAGVSIGPFRSSDAEEACKRILNRFAFVGVRDQISFDRARALAPEARVELTFDIAPVLPIVAGTAPPADPAQRRSLGMALCHFERFNGKDPAIEARRIDVIVESVLRGAASGLIDDIVLIDFNGHPDNGDAPVHAELAERLAGRLPVTHMAYRDDPAAVLGTISGLKGLLAMRLHAAVFAFCTQTPVVVFSYHEKCREWARMIGQPERLVLDSAAATAEELDASLQTLLSPGPPQTAMTWDEASSRSMQNWTWRSEQG